VAAGEAHVVLTFQKAFGEALAVQKTPVVVGEVLVERKLADKFAMRYLVVEIMFAEGEIPVVAVGEIPHDDAVKCALLHDPQEKGVAD